MQNCQFGCRGSMDRIGVLVAQLGTPAAPTKKALRPYLKQFLWDPRVIEGNRLLWWSVLHGLVLTRRPKRSAALYKRIWQSDGSPLLRISGEQTKLLSQRLKKVSAHVEVALGMRYGEPDILKALDGLIHKGCSKILLFPMYPQYSASTSASTYDVVFSHLLKRRWVPTLRVAEPYYAHPGYIRSLASIINDHLSKLRQRPEKLVLSYHGIPEAYVNRGDPYCCMCTETTKQFLPLLNFPAADVMHTYQSRFGRDPWLTPYTDVTIASLARSGIKRISVVCPGFTADCLETLDEMGHAGRKLFLENGGEEFNLIPFLNDHAVWISGWCEIVVEELYSWLRTEERLASGGSTRCPVKEEKQRLAGNE